MKSIEAVDEKEISLSQVRQELYSIKGNLSETISKQREERGHIDESLKENDIRSGTPVE
jgi:flagellar biosynthesis chaperone FliJ